MEAWRGFELQRRLAATFELDARVANDADVAALACATGKGLELTVTLGSGFGSGLTLDGALQPHLECSQLRWSRRETFDDVLGEHARKRDGEPKWHARVIGAIALLHEVVGFDHLHLAGGNAPRVHRDDLGELDGDDDGLGLASGAARRRAPLRPRPLRRPQRVAPRSTAARESTRAAISRQPSSMRNVGLWCGPDVPSGRAAPTKK